jgi:cobyrinic acid a,c-diamide synthase
VSAPRVLMAPTHRSGLAVAVAASIAELVGRQERQVRFHHVGLCSPAAVWDRWEGSSFLDPSLYGSETLLQLYELATRGSDLSLLASTHGLLDSPPGRSWTAADVARTLDAPVVLVVDARGWGRGLAALVDGFNERLADRTLAGLILSGVDDRGHRDLLKAALGGGRPPIVGCLYRDGGLGWDTEAPGVLGLPLGEDLLGAALSQVDLRALERLAAQRAFLPGAAGSRRAGGDDGPLVLVAGGRGFTPWSRDCIELLRSAGGRVRRLDLVEDEELPEDVGGLVLAGRLWPEILPDLAGNYPLMRHIRVAVSEGLPTLALGGGMLYLLRRLQDPFGLTHELAGVLPSDGELLDDLWEPAYFRVRAERDTMLLHAGEEVTGWMETDAEIMEAPVSAAFPFSVRGDGWPDARLEGAAAGGLVCSRVLMHLGSLAGMAQRFVAAASGYAGGR